MIEIEFEEPKIKICECCGKESLTLTRFVFKDGDAFATYLAKFTLGHEDKVVYGLSWSVRQRFEGFFLVKPDRKAVRTVPDTVL